MKQVYRSGDNLGDDPTLGRTRNVGPSKTDQSFKAESDINVLLKRFGITGQILGVERPPSLAEFGEIFDFQSAMDTVNRAKKAFMSLDAVVRATFGNDPQQYVQFCSALNPDGSLKNYDEMVRMKLIDPVPVQAPPEPVRVQVVNPA